MPSATSAVSEPVAMPSSTNRIAASLKNAVANTAVTMALESRANPCGPPRVASNRVTGL